METPKRGMLNLNQSKHLPILCRPQNTGDSDSQGLVVRQPELELLSIWSWSHGSVAIGLRYFFQMAKQKLQLQRSMVKYRIMIDNLILSLQ